MINNTVGNRFKKALELKYGTRKDPFIAKKYNLTPQTIGQAKTKKAINETISLICEKENINLNWIQTGKGEIFINEEFSQVSINENNTNKNDIELLKDLKKLPQKKQEYYQSLIKTEALKTELNYEEDNLL